MQVSADPPGTNATLQGHDNWQGAVAARKQLNAFLPRAVPSAHDAMVLPAATALVLPLVVLARAFDLPRAAVEEAHLGSHAHPSREVDLITN